MGTGKTTIGRQLSRKLSKTFYDSDHEIEQHTGADIPLIFDIEGEQGFRERESKAIEELVQFDNIVLSTGGGVVLNDNNRRLLSENGFIIYLKSSPEKLYKRTAGDKRRPLLQSEDRMNQIQSLLEQREPLYCSLANKIINTDNLTIKQILQNILDTIKDNEAN